MKKLSIILLAVLLTVSLFVSCDNTTKAVTDEHVAVTFSTGADSRSLSYAIEDVSNLQWFYTAKKANQSDPFKYGQTDDNGKPIDLGSVIEFSQGQWNFVLWAEKGAVVTAEGSVTSHGTKVYQGRPEGSVLIKKDTNPQNIIINVSPVIEGVNGSIKFDKIYIALKGDSNKKNVYPSTALIIRENEVLRTITLENGSSDGVISLPPGDYKVTVKHTETFDENTIEYASETLFVTVWSGRETTIKGNITELTGSAIIDGNIQIPTIAAISKPATAGQETIFKASVAPVNNLQSTKMESTTVSFAPDTLTAGDYNLSVEVTNEVEKGINIGSSKGDVATLNLSLKNGETIVSDFNGESATITTYIAKDLTGVKVSYNGSESDAQPIANDDTSDPDRTIAATLTSDEGTKLGYNSATGLLRFTTTHFSEFIVSANTQAEIGGKEYCSLQTAFDVAKANDTIKLTKDVSLKNYVTNKNDVSVNVILDLNGHSITAKGTAIINNGTLTIKDIGTNGKIQSETNVAIAAGDNSITTIESGIYSGREGAVITGYATGATININGGTFEATDNAVIAGNGNKTNKSGAIRENPNTFNITGGTFNGGIITKGYVACGIYAPWKDTINVYGGTFNITGGAGIVARAGNVNVSGGTFTCTGSATGKVGDARNVVPCSALVFDSEANYGAMENDSKITVTGGTFSSASGVNSISVVPKDGDSNKRVVVTGGKFSSELSEDLLGDGFGLSKDGNMWEVITVATVSTKDAFSDALGDSTIKKIVVLDDITFKTTQNITRDVIVDIGSHKLRTEDNKTGRETNSVFSISNGHLILKGNKDGLVKSGTAINPWSNRSNPTISMYNPGCLTIEGITVEGPDAKNETDNKAFYEAGEAIEASSKNGISETGSITIKNAKIKGGIVPNDVQNSSSGYALSAGGMFIVDIDNSEFSTGYIHGGSGNSYYTTIYFSGNTNVTMRNSKVTAPIQYYPQYTDAYRAASAVYHAGGSDSNNYGEITFINCELYGKYNNSYNRGALTLNGFCNVYCDKDTIIKADGTTNSTYDIALSRSGINVVFYEETSDYFKNLRKYTQGSSFTVKSWTVSAK